MVEALLTVLAEDARFRDLPVGVLGNAGVDDERLPNLIRIDSDPTRLVERLLPLVRLQAFESHLKRMLKSLETEGVVDPETGLLARNRVLARSRTRRAGGRGRRQRAFGRALLVRGHTDRRASIDAARLFSRLVRNIDFACREQDGSILAAFTETDLRSAHVVARRLASVLKHTMLSPDRDRRTIKPTVTLATLKPQRQSEHAGGARRQLSRRLPRELQRAPSVWRRPARSRHDRPPASIMVSDVVCPWCFIGKRRLEKAIALKPEIPVEVRFRPYFLNPWVPREGMSREEYLITKFGSVERYNTNAKRVAEQAAAAAASPTRATRSSASPTRSTATG